MTLATDIISVSVAGGSLGLSGWAAYVGHRNRQWQQQLEAERKATAVTIEVAPELVPDEGSSVEDRNTNTTYRLIVAIVNHHAVLSEFVHFVSLENHDHTRDIGIFGHEHAATGSREVPPRKRVSFEFDVKAAIDVIANGFYALAYLGSGATVESDLEELHSEFARDAGLI